MRLKQETEFSKGYNMFTELNGLHSEMLMDFGILKLEKDMIFEEDLQLERVYHIVCGEIEFTWNGQSKAVKRDDFLDDNLSCLNVPRGVKVQIKGIADNSEIAVIRTENEKDFEPKLYTPEDAIVQTRGKDIIGGAGERVVKTIMDVKLSPDSNIMMGEDKQYPGKWSGFPSHYHDQPEIYFYKFRPQQGFSLIKHGEEAVLVEHNDAALIMPGHVHPQACAPGYEMYYLWVIRHLEGNPFIKPTMVKKHMWVEAEAGDYWDKMKK